MKLKRLTFRILRYKPGRIDPPRFQSFSIPLTSEMSVLDGLDTIRRTQDPSLIYRRCCHHASCGTCACTINGTPALACATRIDALEGERVTLAPLRNHSCIADLAVETNGFFADYDPHWATIRNCNEANPERTPQGIGTLNRLENCIECGICVSACPEVSEALPFLGPAVLAAMKNECRNHPENAPAIIGRAAKGDGTSRCMRHITCSRVCPSEVYPARQIADLKRVVAANWADK